MPDNLTLAQVVKILDPQRAIRRVYEKHQRKAVLQMQEEETAWNVRTAPQDRRSPPGSRDWPELSLAGSRGMVMAGGVDMKAAYLTNETWAVPMPGLKGLTNRDGYLPPVDKLVASVSSWSGLSAFRLQEHGGEIRETEEAMRAEALKWRTHGPVRREGADGCAAYVRARVEGGEADALFDPAVLLAAVATLPQGKLDGAKMQQESGDPLGVAEIMVPGLQHSILIMPIRMRSADVRRPRR